MSLRLLLVFFTLLLPAWPQTGAANGRGQDAVPAQQLGEISILEIAPRLARVLGAGEIGR